MSQYECVERPVWPVFPDYLFLVTMIPAMRIRSSISCRFFQLASYTCFLLNMEAKKIFKMFYANTRAAGRFQFNLTCKNCQTKSRFTHFQKNYMKIASQCNLKPCLSVETAMHFLKIHKSVLCKIKIDLLYL